ncbi:MAG: uracil-DNA glycosylase [Thermoleophilia bacterium]|nr:uracil-DNA glycosylase [Thermoleophilia bacterium]GIK77239.1 MAG: DNA polymerase [Actinomycetes bacterium]
MSGAGARRDELVAVYRTASECTLCPLAETRATVVFGAGDADADLMFIGEAPGAEEDRRGLPFVGRAGGLLNELLGEIGLGRDDVFIANTLMCRPPGNRDPQPDELAACRPYLLEKVRLIEPKVIATLGNFATKLITGDQTGITRVRGRPQVHHLGVRTVRVFPILHPAAALRTPKLRPTMSADFAALGRLLGEPAPVQDPASAGQGERRADDAPEPDRGGQLDIFAP